MKEYDNIKVSMCSSVPLGLLKEFDAIAKKKGYKRSGLVVKLMQYVVNKEKKETQK